MADTYTQALKARKIEQGAYADSYATRFNEDMVDVFDAGISGVLEIDIGSSTTYALEAMQNGTLSETHYRHLRFVGTPASAVTITVPTSVNTDKDYIVENQTGQSLTFKYAATAGQTIANGALRHLLADGTNIQPFRPENRRTAAEVTAGVTPVDYGYAPGDVRRYGTNTTPGTTDMSSAIQAALDVAWRNGGNVFVPAGRYLASGLVIPGGVTMYGEGAHTGENSDAVGTIIVSNAAAGNPTITLGNTSTGNTEDVRSVRLRDIKVQGDGTTGHDGIVIAALAHDVEITSCAADDFRYGFRNAGAWIVHARNLTARNNTECFRFEGSMTSSVWQSCVAYDSDYGFRFTSNITYNTFISCASDDCDIGFLIEGALRGTTFQSPGIENASTAGFRVNNASTAVVLINPNFGNHSSTEINLLDLVAADDVVVLEWKVSSAFSPTGAGKILGITSAARVLLLSPYLFGSNLGDIDHASVTAIGGSGVVPNRLQAGIVLPFAKSLSGTTGTMTSVGGQSATLFTPASDATYLCSARDSTSGVERAHALVDTNGSGTIVVIDIAENNLQWIASGANMVLQNDSGSDQVAEWSALRIR